MYYWYGIEIDLYPYLKEKQQQGLIWGLTAANFSTVEPHYSRPYVFPPPTFNFHTHLGTFNTVLLLQIKKSKHASVITYHLSSVRGTCNLLIAPNSVEVGAAVWLNHPKKLAPRKERDQ